MSDAPDHARADLPAPRSWRHAASSPVHDTAPVTITTRNGTVVCLPGEPLTQPVRPREAAGPAVRLTPRDQQVLQTVATSTSTTTAAAAMQLGVVLNTVAQHLVDIRREYRVHSTAEALTAARADGYVAPAAHDV